MTPLLCYDYLTEQVKLQQKCIKNIICKKSLIKQNIINICHFRYKKETGPCLLSQRLLGLLLGTGKNGLVTIPEVFAKVLIGPSFFQVSEVTNGQGCKRHLEGMITGYFDIQSVQFLLNFR